MDYSLEMKILNRFAEFHDQSQQLLRGHLFRTGIEIFAFNKFLDEKQLAGIVQNSKIKESGKVRMTQPAQEREFLTQAAQGQRDAIGAAQDLHRKTDFPLAQIPAQIHHSPIALPQEPFNLIPFPHYSGFIQQLV
jgi:hypothetical protein